MNHQDLIYQCQTKVHTLKQDEFNDFQALLYKFKDFQCLELLFSNSSTFKDIQVLYEPCYTSWIQLKMCKLLFL